MLLIKATKTVAVVLMSDALGVFYKTPRECQACHAMHYWFKRVMREVCIECFDKGRGTCGPSGS